MIRHIQRPGPLILQKHIPVCQECYSYFTLAENHLTIFREWFIIIPVKGE